MNAPSLAFAERLRLLLRNRLLASPVGTLLLLVQRSPLVQMLLPEAKLISSSGAIDVAAWAVATVAGLGAYDSVSGATTIATPLTEVIAARKGVCQDFAHLMLACLRAQGLAARYMSGYIETVPPPGQEKLEGSDASHAWCAVYVPTLGWIDFDPTNNLIPQAQHVVLGWGRDFGDVTPLKGVFFGSGKHELTVAVDMKRAG